MGAGGGRIILIEDAEGMREALESLLGAAGLRTAVHASTAALLAADTFEKTRCIVMRHQASGDVRA